MRFATTLEKFDSNHSNLSNLWGHHLPVPDDIAEVFLGEKNRRVVCRLNDAVEFQAALMPKGDGTWFFNINKELRKKLGLKIGSRVTAELRKDESPYGLPIPEELKELLDLDEEGNRLFHALTPGKQRNLLYIVGKPKSSDIRLRKALVVVEYLKGTGGKLDFKELNAALKESNRM